MSRFSRLVSKLKKRKGKEKVKNPRALAAWIGDKKYGKKKMAKMSAASRRRHRRG